MTDPQTPPTGPAAPPAGTPPGATPAEGANPADLAAVAGATAAKGLTEEVSLEDLDKLLDDEDPEFAKAIAELRMIETDTTIEIESSVNTDDTQSSAPLETGSAVESLTGFQKYRLLAKTRLEMFVKDLKAQAVQTGRECWENIRTWPKHSWNFISAGFKAGYQKTSNPIRAVKQFSKTQKIALVSCIVFILLCLTLFVANLRGIWLPYLNEPILGSFEEVAGKGFSYDPKNDVSVFYEAFPKEPHEFLLGKIKVNLTRTEEHPNPMGAFEVIVSVDSKDTAIELGSREVEFNDLIQRNLEEETFESLDTEIGKMRFKSKLKREISNKLTQGWVKEINFKTLILKP